MRKLFVGLLALVLMSVSPLAKAAFAGNGGVSDGSEYTGGGHDVSVGVVLHPIANVVVVTFTSGDSSGTDDGGVPHPDGGASAESTGAVSVGDPAVEFRVKKLGTSSYVQYKDASGIWRTMKKKKKKKVDENQNRVHSATEPGGGPPPPPPLSSDEDGSDDEYVPIDAHAAGDEYVVIRS